MLSFSPLKGALFTKFPDAISVELIGVPYFLLQHHNIRAAAVLTATTPAKIPAIETTSNAVSFLLEPTVGDNDVVGREALDGELSGSTEIWGVYDAARDGEMSFDPEDGESLGSSEKDVSIDALGVDVLGT